MAKRKKVKRGAPVQVPKGSACSFYLGAAHLKKLDRYAASRNYPTRSAALRAMIEEA